MAWINTGNSISTFVSVKIPDVRYSGHLSLLSRSQDKNAVLDFYQLAEYVERILNQNKEMTLGLHNKLAIRGRSSSVHIDLLNRLQSEGESVIELLSN